MAILALFLSIFLVTELAVVLAIWRGDTIIGIQDRLLYPPYWLELILNLFAPVLPGDVKRPRNIVLILGVLTLLTGCILPAVFAGWIWLPIGFVIDLLCFVVVTLAFRFVNHWQ